ncbi:MAG TPA: hypothetical protein VIV55_11285 [Flavobacterium sp.]
MKATKTFLVFTFILLSISSVSAQYGYGTNPYGGRTNSGMSQLSQPSEPNKPKEVPAEKIAANAVEEMKPALNLDELQAIAISNILTESLNKEGRIRKQGLTQDDLVKEYKLLSENTDRQINQFLNKEQKEKYVLYKAEKQNPNKTKEKKSKKKEK